MLVPAVVLVVMALAGCVHVDRVLVLNADGAGTYTLTVGFREPQPGDPTSISPTIVVPMEAFGAHVRQEGGSYRRSADPTDAWWTYAWAFASPAAANRLIQEGPHSAAAARPTAPPHGVGTRCLRATLAHSGALAANETTL